MFDPVQIPHDDLIDQLLRLRSKLHAPIVAQAFSDSLTTRRLDFRSALGSFGAILNLPNHRLDKASSSEGRTGVRQCRICEGYDGKPPVDLNVLNFQRFKWGGVVHSDPEYALLDLSQFEETQTELRSQSHEPLLKILEIAANAAADCRPNDLVKLIAPHVAGNDNHRRVVIQILGYAGILQPTSYPGYFETYPVTREHPGGKNDWQYPVSWWRGRDGVNSAALAFYFPDL